MQQKVHNDAAYTQELVSLLIAGLDLEGVNDFYRSLAQPFLANLFACKARFELEFLAYSTITTLKPDSQGRHALVHAADKGIPHSFA